MKDGFKFLLVVIIVIQNILSSSIGSSKSKKAYKNLNFFRIDLKNLSSRLDNIGEKLSPIARLRFSLNSLSNYFNAREFEERKFFRLSGRLVSKIYGLEDLDLVIGEEIKNFELLKVEYIDGEIDYLGVAWKTDYIDLKSPGSYYLPGVLDKKMLVYRSVNVVDHIPSEPDSPEDLKELEESEDFEIGDLLDQPEALIKKKTKEEELEEEMGS